MGGWVTAGGGRGSGFPAWGGPLSRKSGFSLYARLQKGLPEKLKNPKTLNFRENFTNIVGALFLIS